MKVALIIGLIFALVALTIVLRHALMILPFVATAAYLYWNSGKDDDETISE